MPHSEANRESTAFFPKELIVLPKQEERGETPRVKYYWRRMPKVITMLPGHCTLEAELYKVLKRLFISSLKLKRKIPKRNYTRPIHIPSCIIPPQPLHCLSTLFISSLE